MPGYRNNLAFHPTRGLTPQSEMSESDDQRPLRTEEGPRAHACEPRADANNQNEFAVPPALAPTVGADGVHLDDVNSVVAARRELGADAIVGVGCGASRDAAVVAAEAGADYVAFGPAFERGGASPAVLEVIAWWRQMTVVPCVAHGGLRLDNVAPFVAAGADFLAGGSAVWSEEGGNPPGEDVVAHRVTTFNTAVATAGSSC